MIHLTSFKGEAPAFNDKNLPAENAVIAQNVELKNGTLKSLNARTPVAANLATGTNSIYFYEDQYWFSWTADVSALKSPIAQDNYRRIYYTQNNTVGVAPQVTSNLIATGAGVMPTASYDLGVPQPDTSPVITGSTTPEEYDEEDFQDDETRAYTITFRTEYSEEGPPSVASEVIVIPTPDTTVDLSLPSLVANTANITHKRIYRTAGESGEFFFVAEVPLAQATFTDSVLGTQLGEPLTTIDFFPPPEKLQGLTLMANGIAAGFIDNEVYFSEPYLPYAYPPRYQLSTEHDIVAIEAIQTSLVVLTKGVPYIFSGVSPDALSEDKLAMNQACVSSRSVVNIGNAVVYASPDGLVAITPGKAQLITETTQTKQTWTEFKPETIHGYFYESQYIGFYGDSSDGGGFIFDLTSNSFVRLDFYAEAGYSDISTDTLYLSVNDELFAWDSEESRLKYVWRSKVFDSGRKAHHVVRARTENGQPVQLKIWADSRLILNAMTISDIPIRIPATKAKAWQVEVIGTNELTSLTLAESMSQLKQI